MSFSLHPVWGAYSVTDNAGLEHLIELASAKLFTIVTLFPFILDKDFVGRYLGTV